MAKRQGVLRAYDFKVDAAKLDIARIERAIATLNEHGFDPFLAITILRQGITRAAKSLGALAKREGDDNTLAWAEAKQEEGN